MRSEPCCVATACTCERRPATDGTRYLYGDRHQYTKMATLFTHTGLIVFLIAAAVTSRLGDEQGLVVPEGSSLTVQPIGTPGLLLVKNLDFEAPGFDTGQATDFTTDLAVYQDGREIARKTIRVNDPLSVAGYTFHQNGFGPAPYLVVRDAAGKPLWDGAVPLTDAAAGCPTGSRACRGPISGCSSCCARSPTGRASCSSCRIGSSGRTRWHAHPTELHLPRPRQGRDGRRL